MTALFLLTLGLLSGSPPSRICVDGAHTNSNFPYRWISIDIAAATGASAYTAGPNAPKVEHLLPRHKWGLNTPEGGEKFLFVAGYTTGGGTQVRDGETHCRNSCYRDDWHTSRVGLHAFSNTQG
ncbi:hypothetical protein C8Q79DRAFT_954934 [Trametes meyenii]|nr:hypothetical protein C8Q79DRAFT_954934 [Trametes meyenii]